jgi:predicted metal-dependent hydrolase
MQQPSLPFGDAPPTRTTPVPPASDDTRPLPVASASTASGASLEPVVPITPRAVRTEFVRHPRARRYVLRVSHDGTVRVTIPRWGSRREAEAFAVSERRWIEKQLRKAEVDRARPKPAPLPPDEVRAWRARAAQELPRRLRELAAAHGLAVSRVSVRDQRWRWGSCSRNGHICLNWRLVRMPDWVRDYVMIHELMHLRRMDHSPKFWKLVAAACPGYEAARTWLRQHGERTDRCDVAAVGLS